MALCKDGFSIFILNAKCNTIQFSYIRINLFSSSHFKDYHSYKGKMLLRQKNKYYVKLVFMFFISISNNNIYIVHVTFDNSNIFDTRIAANLSLPELSQRVHDVSTTSHQ